MSARWSVALRSARRRTQGGYMLASTLGFAGLVVILLVSMLAMTGTAFKIGERFRETAQVDAAADSALEIVTNALRRQPFTSTELLDDNLKKTCADKPLPDPHTFAVTTGTYVLPVPLPGAPDSVVTVTCSITLPASGDDDVSESSRTAELRAYVDLPVAGTVDAFAKPNGLALVQIFHQVDGNAPTRLAVKEWRIGNGADAVVVNTPLPQLKVEFLVVGGGGAGGARTGGGGGGGGIISNVGGRPLRVDNGQFNVTVGAGGPGGQPVTNRAANGQPSTFNGITAIGGGGGGINQQLGAVGGSGGGGGHEADALPANLRSTAGTGQPGQGNDGGSGSNEAGVYGGGGGGGAGAVGGKGSPTKGGNGGAGVTNNITGTPIAYAAGGGGGAFGGNAASRGLGGSGGGGTGGAGPSGSPIPPTYGQNGTGSGGGGQRTNVAQTGGAGGSGVVIVRYGGTPRSVGGVITQVGGYTIHTFSTPGNFTLTIKPAVEYLVVGGGGAGGPSTGGGGGAGGVLTNLGTPSLIEPGTYTISVGAGGAGAQPQGPSKRGANGQNSRFDSTIATGGGGGAANLIVGASGGSGGGGGHENDSLPSGSRSTSGAGNPGQGNPGGTGSNEAGVYGAGAGGGAGASGGSGSPMKGGNGGAARSIDITGVTVLYGAGGGGGAFGGTAAAVGVGGGGIGGNGGAGSNAAPVPPTAGVVNTGSGGGGQRTNVNSTGGAGGSGLVIIRYAGVPRATGGTISQVGGYTLHTFSTPGTFSITFP